jgi:hypothetical protein
MLSTIPRVIAFRVLFGWAGSDEVEESIPETLDR